MRRFDIKRAFVFLAAILMIAVLPLRAFAADDDDKEENERVYKNSDTGYEAYVDDPEYLLTASQMDEVLDSMKDLTDEGNVVFVTANLKAGAAERYAENYFQDRYGTEAPGLIFLIDMGDRLLLLQAHNGLDSKITGSKANSIVDNVYTYAGDGDYAKCAISVYEQCDDVLAGLRIAEPFKYISNIFIAIIVAFLLGFMILGIMTSTPAASNKEIIKGLFSQLGISNRNANLINVSKRYSPQSSGSSGGGSSHSSGGSYHSSGGHHSSGSHHF